MPEPAGILLPDRKFVTLVGKVVDVHRAPIHDGAARDRAAVERRPLVAHGDGAAVRDEREAASLPHDDRGIVGLAQQGRGAHEATHDLVAPLGPAAHRLQQLCRRRLLAPRLGELAPQRLDRDHVGRCRPVARRLGWMLAGHAQYPVLE